MRIIMALVTLALVVVLAPSAALADGYYLMDSSKKDGPAMGTAQNLSLNYPIQDVWCGCEFHREFGLPYPTREPLLGHLYHVYGWGDSPDMAASDAAMVPVTTVVAGLPTILTTNSVRFIQSFQEMEKSTGTARNSREIFLIQKYNLCVRHYAIPKKVEAAITNKQFGKVAYSNIEVGCP